MDGQDKKDGKGNGKKGIPRMAEGHGFKTANGRE
jgi:hypothetical protein